jgi:hypothetical protein
LRLSATNPPARTSRATDQAPRLSDRVPRPERAPPPDRAPGLELVPSQAVVLAPPPSQLAGGFHRPTNCATNKKRRAWRRYRPRSKRQAMMARTSVTWWARFAVSAASDTVRSGVSRPQALALGGPDPMSQGREWRRGMRLDILSVWNHAAFIENRTAGQKTNTAHVSNMTNTRSLTYQRAFTEQEATSRRLMNCLGWMRSRLPRRASSATATLWRRLLVGGTIAILSFAVKSGRRCSPRSV